MKGFFFMCISSDFLWVYRILEVSHGDSEWIPWLSNIAARYEKTSQMSLLTIVSRIHALGSGSTDKIFDKNDNILVTRNLFSCPMCVLFVWLRCLSISCYPGTDGRWGDIRPFSQVQPPISNYKTLLSSLNIIILKLLCKSIARPILWYYSSI